MVPSGAILAAIGCTVFWLFLFHPVYEASSLLRISATEEFIAYSLVSAGQYDRDPFVRTQLAIIQDPVVLERVVTREDVARLPDMMKADDSISWLKQRLSIQRLESSELYRILFQAHDREQAAVINNAIMDSYLDVHQTQSMSKNRTVIDLLEDEQRVRAGTIENMQNEIRALAGSESTLAEATQDQLILSQTIASAMGELARLEADREVAEAQLAAAREKLENIQYQPDERLLKQAVRQRPEYLAALQRLVQSEVHVESSQGMARDPDTNKYLADLKMRVTAGEELLSKLEEDLQEDALNELQLNYEQSLYGRVSQLEAGVAERRTREDVMRLRISRLRESITGPESDNLELEFKRSELEREQLVYDRITERLQAFRTEQGRPSRVSIVRRAKPPVSPLQAAPVKEMMAISLAALCAPFCLALVWEKRASYIAAATQLSHDLSVPVLGEIPPLPLQPVRRTVAAERKFEKQQAVFHERIHYLRTNLTLSCDPSESSVIVIASSVSGEGKTSIAVQLAVSLAETCVKPVLLIDGDMRNPDIHDRFEVELEPGLADFLVENCTLEDAIQQDPDEPNLHILAGGIGSRRFHEMLSNGRWRRLVEQLRDTYCFVIVDTPPLLAVSDGLVMARAADGTVLCTRRDYSRSNEVRDALGKLLHAGAKPIGTILTGLDQFVRFNWFQYGNDRYTYYLEGEGDSNGVEDAESEVRRPR